MGVWKKTFEYNKKEFLLFKNLQHEKLLKQ